MATDAVQHAIAADSSASRDTLTRLEASLGAITEGFQSYRDDVSQLKLQQQHQQTQMQELAQDFKTDLGTIAASFRSEMEKFAVQIGHIAEKIEGKRIGVGVWTSILGVVFVFFSLFTAAAAFFVNAEISNAIAPLVQFQAQMTQMLPNIRESELASTRSTQADARSEIDRSELNRRVGVLESKMADESAQRREQFSALNAGRVEIETQFKNLTQMTYYLWHKTMGETFPIVPREDTSQGSKW
jgi:peptidoglycan hydrolase CwlO-like protein